MQRSCRLLPADAWQPFTRTLVRPEAKTKQRLVLTAVALSLALVTPLRLAAQASPTPPTSPASSASSPSHPHMQVLGTDVDFEGSGADKSADLGLAVPPQDEAQSPASANNKEERRGEFAFAPIPMVNPSIGNGGGAAVLYATRLQENDTSPASIFALGGFGTGSASWGFVVGTRMYLSNDRYRILGVAGGGEFNYNYFGIGTDAGESGISIPLSQRSRAFLIEPKMRVWRRWYVGPRYHLITNRISLGSHELDPDTLPIPLPEDLKFQTAALGARIQRDTSGNPFYPRNGSLVDLMLDFYDPAVGADRSYTNFTASYNKYLSLGPKNVLAVHGSLCTVTDKAPFFDLCLLGLSKDIRGYQIGQFRDSRMLVGQTEFRRELFWRIGAVAFAGAGAVGKTFNDMGSPEPGGGIGLRVLLAKRNHINLRTDFAWGDGSHAFYVSMGEAF